MISQIGKMTKKAGSSLCLLFCLVMLAEFAGGCAVASNGRRGWYMYGKYRSGSDSNVTVAAEADGQQGAAANGQQGAGAGQQDAGAGQQDGSANGQQADGSDAKSDDEGSPVWDAILWYLPNRICDLVDCFTIEIGGGLNARLDLHLTQAIALGAGYGNEYMVGWDRRYFGGEKRWSEQFDGLSYKADLFYLGIEKRKIENLFGNFPSYVVDRRGVININAPEYDRGKRDFWAIGLDLGLLYNIKLEIHPLAIVDFITGLFFIDIEKDDYPTRSK